MTMKKILSVLLIAVIMMSLSSCGKKSVEFRCGNLEDKLVNGTVDLYLENCDDMDTVRSLIDEYGAVSVGKHYGIELYAVNMTPSDLDGKGGVGEFWFLVVNESDKDMEFVRAKYKVNGDDGIKSGYGGFDHQEFYEEVKAGGAIMLDVGLISAPFRYDEYEEVELTLYINEPGSDAKEKKWGTVLITVNYE